MKRFSWIGFIFLFLAGLNLCEGSLFLLGEIASRESEKHSAILLRLAHKIARPTGPFVNENFLDGTQSHRFSNHPSKTEFEIVAGQFKKASGALFLSGFVFLSAVVLKRRWPWICGLACAIGILTEMLKIIVVDLNLYFWSISKMVLLGGCAFFWAQSLVSRDQKE